MVVCVELFLFLLYGYNFTFIVKKQNNNGYSLTSVFNGNIRSFTFKKKNTTTYLLI